MDGALNCDLSHTFMLHSKQFETESSRIYPFILILVIFFVADLFRFIFFFSAAGTVRFL